MTYQIIQGNSLQKLKELPDNSIDSIITDPPYELGFMGKKWDGSGIANNIELWTECLRVLKPGGYLLSFGGTRTYHRMTCAIEDSGFEIRDSIHWTYGSGFPKSLNIGDGRGTALKPSHEPIVLARKPLVGTVAQNVLEFGTGGLNIDGSRVGTDDTRSKASLTALGQGSGWNAHENKEVVAGSASGRWPANTVLTHSAGCVCTGQTEETVTINTFDQGAKPWGNAAGEDYTSRTTSTVTPVYQCVPGCPVPALDTQSGTSKSTVRVAEDKDEPANTFALGRTGVTPRGHADKGGASRYFKQTTWEPEWDDPFIYCAKPSKKERNAGLTNMPSVTAGEATGGRKENSAGLNSPRAGAGRTGNNNQNTHPTVKPVQLMKYLCTLVTPSGGTVLDPFTGSGTTGVAAILSGYNFIGIELTAEYIPIITARLQHAANSITPTLFEQDNVT